MTWRLLRSYLAIAIIVLVVLEVPLGIVYAGREQDRLASAAESDATVLATLYEEVLEARAVVDFSTEADSTPVDEYADRTGARVVVVDASGISIVDSGSGGVNRDFSTRPEIASALTGRTASGTRHSDTLDSDLLYVAVPVASGGKVWGAVRITIDTHEVTERVRSFWLGLLWVALVILVAMTAIGWAIAVSVTRPIRNLQAAAARFAQGDLSATEPNPGAPPEIRNLQADLDTMAHQLDGLLKRQRAFVADASHQLRTPLTAIRLRLDNLQSEIDDPTLLANLDATITETDRLTTLVGDLLSLARAERAPEPMAVELTAIARDRADTWGAVAEQHGVTMAMQGPTGELWAMSVPGGVEQMLDNLIDNAVGESAPGSTVTITVEAGSPTHQVTVADDGPGLDDEQKARALDRFWRGRADRPGTGLGLPIVTALAESSGGSVTLTDNHPRGLAAVISLPAASAPAGDHPVLAAPHSNAAGHAPG